MPVILVPFSHNPATQGVLRVITKEETGPVRHAILTCYDPRIDAMVDREINHIRSQGGILQGKDIMRPPGGVHMLAGKTDCRKAFYEMLTGLRDIAHTTVFHLWPHTNCQYCGMHFQEKLGTGSKSDLRFHLKSAEKMLGGVMDHFAGSASHAFEIDVRIVLTADQELITIEQAHALLPHVPEHHQHGTRVHHPHHTGNGHDSATVHPPVITS